MRNNTGAKELQFQDFIFSGTFYSILCNDLYSLRLQSSVNIFKFKIREKYICKYSKIDLI